MVCQCDSARPIIQGDVLLEGLLQRFEQVYPAPMWNPLPLHAHAVLYIESPAEAHADPRDSHAARVGKRDSQCFTAITQSLCDRAGGAGGHCAPALQISGQVGDHRCDLVSVNLNPCDMRELRIQLQECGSPAANCLTRTCFDD